MSVMLSAASCLRWVTGLVGGASEAAVLAEVATLDEVGRAAAPIFLPYLSGERTPHNDPAAQGVFFGLTHGVDRRALVYSVIEGVTFGLADGLDALASAGTKAGALSLVGGGSRSALWAQLIADVLRTQLQIHAGGEAGAALGAARLAQLACGAEERTVCTRPPVASEYLPSRDASARLQGRLDRFRALYRALSPVWTEAGEREA
jgi:xylulokinase